MLNRRLSLILMGATALVPAALAATGEDAKFAAIAARWLDRSMQLSPVSATQTGDHRFDGEIDDMSPGPRPSSFCRQVLTELKAMDRSQAVARQPGRPGDTGQRAAI